MLQSNPCICLLWRSNLQGVLWSHGCGLWKKSRVEEYKQLDGDLWVLLVFYTGYGLGIRVYMQVSVLLVNFFWGFRIPKCFYFYLFFWFSFGCIHRFSAKSPYDFVIYLIIIAFHVVNIIMW